MTLMLGSLFLTFEFDFTLLMVSIHKQEDKNKEVQFSGIDFFWVCLVLFRWQCYSYMEVKLWIINQSSLLLRCLLILITIVLAEAATCCNKKRIDATTIIDLTKNPSKKKIPQRGLGVAQLEKIRLEEQQKKEASDASISASPWYIPLPKSHPFSPPLTPNCTLQRSPSLPDFVFYVPNLHNHFSPSFIQNLNNPSQIDSCSATPNHGFMSWPSFGDESS